jgi:arylsulfatase
MGSIRETAGYPQVYNIEGDPKERVDLLVEGYSWTMAPYMKLIMEYKASLKDHPNPPAGNLTRF